MSSTSDSEYYKEWYLKNKDKHNKYMLESISCQVCNTEIKRCSVTKHNKTKKHLLNLLVKDNKNDIKATEIKNIIDK